jgi:hypothetical protein
MDDFVGSRSLAVANPFRMAKRFRTENRREIAGILFAFDVIRIFLPDRKARIPPRRRGRSPGADFFYGGEIKK